MDYRPGTGDVAGKADRAQIVYRKLTKFPEHQLQRHYHRGFYRSDMLTPSFAEALKGRPSVDLCRHVAPGHLGSTVTVPEVHDDGEGQQSVW